MPPVDERDLRDLARHLANLYQELDSLKYSRPTPPEVRAMKPAPGPQSPGNWLMVSTYIDMEQRLREICFNAFGRDGIGITIAEDDFTAPRLCGLIAWHAQALSELDWAADLLQELEDQARMINRWVNPPQVPRVLIRQAESSEQLLTASHVAKAASAATGKRVDRKQITYWGNAGYITTHYDNQGKSCYKLGEIVDYLHKQE
ncbi:hypothetical protein [Corynebacterium striatum]|uniref:hypothetical protein n=1 Tax=Corynebacterium striatum TaxID=43770 RepID=UPI003B5CB029